MVRTSPSRQQERISDDESDGVVESSDGVSDVAGSEEDEAMLSGGGELDDDEGTPGASEPPQVGGDWAQRVVEEADRISFAPGQHQAPLDTTQQPPAAAVGRAPSLSGWESHLYLLMAFLTAYCGISEKTATLIARIISKVLPMLFDTDQGLVRFLDQVHLERITIPRIVVTPACMRKTLGIQDDYDRYAVCPGCAQLYLWNGRDDVLPATCRHCGWGLLCGSKPLLTYSHRPLANILKSVLQDQRSEDGVEAWYQHVQRSEGTAERRYSTLWSGELWRADCSSSSCGTPCLSRHVAFVDFPMHIKITLSIDWFSAFHSRYSGTHSSGAILMRIDNIPSSLFALDRRCAGIHLVGILPGPKETTREQLDVFLEPLIEELAKLHTDGIRIPTARHPEGK